MAVDPRPVLQARYRLEELLRHGGPVQVHRAFDLLLQREVLATLSTYPSGDVADGTRHQQAARLVASLSHHNLVPVLDYQRIDDVDGTVSLLVVLEMAQGRSLRNRLREGVPLTTKQAAYLGFDLAEAFEHLHERGIVLHGITPAAVFLAEQDDGFLRAQLADLASAVRADDPTQVPVDSRPTVTVWAPERLRGEPASAAGDVYMLGLLVLEALTGRAAFPDPVDRAAHPDAAPTVPDGTPAGLAALLRGATSTDPAERPGSTELAVGFRRFIAEEFGRHRRLDPSLRSAADEEARLAALHRYDLLDTPPEGAFDRITTLAARALHMPVSTVSIVDRDRIWFKSHYGLEGGEIGRDPGLCATVVETGAPVYVSDARADPSTRDNPLIAGDIALQSYAGVPLTSVDGYALGSLSVADYRPRTLTGEELDILDRLGRMITHELEMRLATRRALLSHD
ncbi:MAG: GAF domain-containing protein [Acidobacteria bacterium]|nr:GAF domain-containing protein [Acidobacteriota bacterium]